MDMEVLEDMAIHGDRMEVLGYMDGEVKCCNGVRCSYNLTNCQ
jgi:hypothetical protein